MRAVVSTIVLLAVVATALAGVRQHAENRRLEYQVWESLRRRDRMTKQIRELESAIEKTLSPRRLLMERDRRGLADAPAAPTDGGAE